MKRLIVASLIVMCLCGCQEEINTGASVVTYKREKTFLGKTKIVKEITPIDSSSCLTMPDYGLFGKDIQEIKKGKVVAELKIFDTGEGYIKIGDKEGKLYSMELNFNIENLVIGGEDYKLIYRTSYWIWGDYRNMIFDLYKPQDEWKNINELLKQLKKEK